LQARAQSVDNAGAHGSPPAFVLDYSSSLPDPEIAPEPSLPSVPGSAGGDEPWDIAPSGTTHQLLFSRIGIGADISPLGIGIKSATVLTQYFDARVMANFFNFNSGRVEVEGFNGRAQLHLASAAVSIDWYPFNSIWRLSPGLMFFNGNRFSASAQIVGGTSFTLNGQTFYGAATNAATGATPLVGTGTLGLHTNQPAFMLAGGFGKFIPRSKRHWSFPAEFGVVLMGAPTVNVNASGWVCLDRAQTQCSNLADSTDPVALQFHGALEAQVAKWRMDLSKVQVYPIFSYSVMYSFSIR
jgi:hypothetical protein